MYKNIVNTVLKAVAFAMSVAVVVLNILGTTTVQNQVNLMSFGLVALALAALQQK